MFSPRGKAQTYSLDEVVEQWGILKHFHRRLVELSGVEENQQLDKFLDYLFEVLQKDSCPPSFLLGQTSTRAEVIRKTWDSLLLEAKEKTSESNYHYLVKKLRAMKNIEEVLDYIRSGENFCDSETAVEKSSRRQFNQTK